LPPSGWGFSAIDLGVVMAERYRVGNMTH
jgi:hypothetical protein